MNTETETPYVKGTISPTGESYELLLSKLALRLAFYRTNEQDDKMREEAVADLSPDELAKYTEYFGKRLEELFAADSFMGDPRDKVNFDSYPVWDHEF